jgi:hypothetical protein
MVWLSLCLEKSAILNEDAENARQVLKDLAVPSRWMFKI